MKFSFGDKHVVCKGKYWIAPNAVVIGSVTLEENASVWFNAMLRGDGDEIVIGENSQIQDWTCVHVSAGKPVRVGRNVSVGHHVQLHGCTIGDGSLVGIGAIVLNGAVVGENCLIGAGALVPPRKVIPPGSLVVGSPCKVLRQLTAEQIEHIHANAQHYVDNFNDYAKSLLAEP